MRKGVSMADPIPIYVFHGLRGAADPAVASAAPLDLAISVFGGGGLHGEGGVSSVFGGSAFFRNAETGQAYLGVWGARKASRFRRMLRESGAVVQIVRKRPPARLIHWSTAPRDGRRSWTHQERFRALFRS